MPLAMPRIKCENCSQRSKKRVDRAAGANHTTTKSNVCCGSVSTDSTWLCDVSDCPLEVDVGFAGCLPQLTRFLSAEAKEQERRDSFAGNPDRDAGDRIRKTQQWLLPGCLRIFGGNNKNDCRGDRQQTDFVSAVCQ